MKSKYFVLKPNGNTTYARASRIAMICYANEIQKVDPKLACEIQDWVEEEKVVIKEYTIDIVNPCTEIKLGDHVRHVPDGWDIEQNCWTPGTGPYADEE